MKGEIQVPNSAAEQAVRELAALVSEHLDAANAYEKLLAKEAAGLFYAQMKDKRAEELFPAFARIAALPGKTPLLAAHTAARLFCSKGFPPLREEFESAADEVFAMPETRFDSEIKKRFSDARFLSSGSFESACEETAEGGATGCFLPLYDGAGAPNPGMARLCVEYGLKKSALISLSDERQSAVFALVRTKLSDSPGVRFAEISLSGRTQIENLPALFGLCRVDVAFSGNARLTDADARDVLRISGKRADLLVAAFAAELLYGCGLESFYEYFDKVE